MSLVATRIRSGARCEEVDAATLGGAVRQRAAMPASSNTPDFVLPALDVRALARRAAIPAGLAAVATAAVVVAGGPLRAFGDALGRALDADPRWVVAGGALRPPSFVRLHGEPSLVGGPATPPPRLRAGPPRPPPGGARAPPPP